MSPHPDNLGLSDVDSNPTENVVHFEESFQFNVQTGQEQVTLALMAREEVGSPQVIGYAKFKLRPEYEDQLVHGEEWYNLDKGGQVIGKICLKVQWIYDQLLFLQKALQTQEDSIKMYEEQQFILEQHLKDYRAPFKNILDPKDHGIESSGIEQEKQYVELMRDPFGRQINEFEDKAQTALDPFMSWLASMCGYEREHEADFFYHLILLALAVYFFLTLASAFGRPDFLNLTIVTLCILQINEPRFLRRNYFRLLILMVIISIFYDIYWTLYLSSEFSKDQQNPEESAVDVYHKQNAVTWTIFNIVWKAFVFLPTIWRVSLDFKAILKDHS